MQQQTIQRLHQLRLPGFVEGLVEQEQSKHYGDLPFEERLGFLVEKEHLRRENNRLNCRLKTARLKQSVTVEAVDYAIPRKLSKSQFLELVQCGWIKNSQHLIIHGPTGIGKSFLACALGDQACKLGYTVRYTKMRELLSDILQSRADGSYRSFSNRLAKTSLLIIDEWLREPLSQADAREIADLVDDRYRTASCVFASQLSPKDWYQHIADPTLGESILDRLVHESLRLELTGESIRKLRGTQTASQKTILAAAGLTRNSSLRSDKR
jgi:DNA replication protein DnaC